jgi:hypothetical protein
MTSRYRRASEKTKAALHRLAVGEGDVRQRLKSAYWVLCQLSETDLPPELQNNLHSIKKELTRFGPETGPDGEIYKKAVDHTMSRIQNRTGRKIAEKIYTLCRDVEYIRKERT